MKNNNLTNISFIRETLKSHAFVFDKRMGQNFLTSSHIPEKIASYCKKDWTVLEIGSGFGALTAALSENAKEVIALEKDRRLIKILESNLSGFTNITLHEADVLKTDFAKIIPSSSHLACFSNLPYSITTPILTKLIESELFDPIIVMLQKEVAERLTAKPATSEYGALTLFAALYATCETLFDVSPECFTPRPNVMSRVVRFKKLPPDPRRERLRKTAQRLVKAAFSQRRKTLLNALSSGLVIPRNEVSQKIASAGFDINLRGEVLSADDYLALAEVFS